MQVLKNAKKTSMHTISIKAITLTLLFLISSLGAAVFNPAAAATQSGANSMAAASPLASAGLNWAYTDGNQFAQDYSPQTQINSSNAQNLILNWLWPAPAFPTSLVNSFPFTASIDTSPLIINGTVYIVTVFGQVTALNAATGNLLWTDVLPINNNSTLGQGTGILQLHLHQGEQTFTDAKTILGGTPTYWISAPNHVIYAINALNGTYEHVGTALDGGFPYYTGVNAGINGNSPTSNYAGAATTSSNIVFDTQRGILLTGMFVPSASSAARCFVKGWNMEVSPPVNIWTSYCTPPQPNSNVPLNPNWDVQQINNMTGAEIFYPGPAYNNGGHINASAVVNLKTLDATTLNATLYNDWGYQNQTPFCQAASGGQSTGGTGSGWGGSWIIDSNTGLGYINTNNRGPYAGACNPGPDLWASSIMAINDQTGQWVWGFDTSAHDNWDWDCSWYQGLGNQTINGVNTEVLYKTCKNGYVYELNAANGNLIWAWTPPSSIIPRCQYCFIQNPLNRTQMTNDWAAPNNENFIANPSELAGFESTASFDPATNMVYVTSHNVPEMFNYAPLNATNFATNSGINAIAGLASFGQQAYPDNATVEAINAATGQMVWDHYIPTVGFRGGLMSSGNVVYAPLVSGDLLMLNAQNGTVIRDFFMGAPSDVTPAIGPTLAGVEEVFLEVGSSSFFGTSSPGDLVALALNTIGGTTTVTATSTATATASATTVTSISTSTQSGGASNTTLYGVAAVAVVFIIATGYLAMRGRKPAS